MAGRHGVPPPERRTHARQAGRQRRRRTQRRDAAQPWLLWLAFRALLALVVLAAGAWSVLLLTQHRGGIWPVIAVVAGALSLLMIALDVRARKRQRARMRRPAGARRAAAAGTAVPTVPALPAGSIVPGAAGRPEPTPEPAVPDPQGEPAVPDPPPRRGRHAHRA